MAAPWLPTGVLQTVVSSSALLLLAVMLVSAAFLHVSMLLVES